MKKISVLILMLTFLLIPTCVNANDISWNDFVAEVQKATTRDVEQDLNNYGGLNTLKTQFNNCYAFYVFGNFGFSSDNLVAGADKIYFYFVTDNRVPTSVLFNTDGSAWRLYFRYYNDVFTYDLKTGSITSTFITGSNRVFITYNLTEQMDDLWSSVKFNSKTGLDYFLTTSYLIGWNATAQCNYYEDYPNNNTNITIDLEDLFDSDFPWEDGNAGGNTSGDIYYNYDFIGPNPQPYLKVFNTNGYMGDGSGDGIFTLYTYISDKKYSIDTLKLDLEVYEISQTYQLKLVNTYKNYNGRLLNANGTYQTVSSGESSVVYTYNMVDAFGADFLSQYLDDVKNYAFTIKLYDINENLLSKVDLLYFGVDNTLNYYPSLDDYYNPPYNNNGYGDINLNTDFSDLVDIFLGFMSTVMGFLSIFPLWMTTLIGMGITVAIILRIGGR